MHYPIAIEPGGNSIAFGVVVPDLPGCFSAGDTLAKAMSETEEAIPAWIDSVVDAGGAIPQPSTLEAIQNRPDYAGWTFAIVGLGQARLDG